MLVKVGLAAYPLLLSAVALGATASGGLSLLSDGGARPTSLAKAYSAGSDDISAFVYNPASLGTLSSGRASFLYQQGLIDESRGQLMVGKPMSKKSSLGFMFGAYSGGNLDLTEDSGATHSVKAQQDYTLGLGYSRNMGPLSFGIAGKYLRSTLVEQYSAQAAAVDLGLQMKLSSRVRVGAAALNYGSQLKYATTGDNLPRMLRAGTAISLFSGKAPTTLLLDAPYMVNEKQLIPSLGLETFIGPLALRGGYRAGSNTKEITFGAGFALDRFSLDYSFGMLNELSGRHTVSVGMKFGSALKTDNFAHAKPNSPLASKTPEPSVPLAKNTTITMPMRTNETRVYVVKEGDNLGSIAQNELGDKSRWHAIYAANKHLMEDPTDLKKGMKIIIPN